MTIKSDKNMTIAAEAVVVIEVVIVRGSSSSILLEQMSWGRCHSSYYNETNAYKVITIKIEDGAMKVAFFMDMN